MDQDVLGRDAIVCAQGGCGGAKFSFEVQRCDGTPLAHQALVGIQWVCGRGVAVLMGHQMGEPECQDIFLIQNRCWEDFWFLGLIVLLGTCS